VPVTDDGSLRFMPPSIFQSHSSVYDAAAMRRESGETGTDVTSSKGPVNSQESIPVAMSHIRTIVSEPDTAYSLLPDTATDLTLPGWSNSKRCVESVVVFRT
jgi:hypothetical protein